MKIERPFRRLLVKSILILTGLFSLSIALIRAQSDDAQDLRTFLMPPSGCPPPCWQGIRPGVTNVYDVMTLLQENIWIRSVHYENYSTFSNGYVRWNWSVLHPPAVRENGFSNLWFDQNIAQSFHIGTEIPFGEVWLALGKPDRLDVYRVNNWLQINGTYENELMMVMFKIPCSQTPRGLWLAKTDISWATELPKDIQTLENRPNVLADCGR
jgi:hypothetical protein